jgi:hypothetical protein
MRRVWIAAALAALFVVLGGLYFYGDFLRPTGFAASGSSDKVIIKSTVVKDTTGPGAYVYTEGRDLKVCVWDPDVGTSNPVPGAGLKEESGKVKVAVGVGSNNKEFDASKVVGQNYYSFKIPWSYLQDKFSGDTSSISVSLDDILGNPTTYSGQIKKVTQTPSKTYLDDDCCVDGSAPNCKKIRVEEGGTCKPENLWVSSLRIFTDGRTTGIGCDLDVKVDVWGKDPDGDTHHYVESLKYENTGSWKEIDFTDPWVQITKVESKAGDRCSFGFEYGDRFVTKMIIEYNSEKPEVQSWSGPNECGFGASTTSGEGENGEGETGPPGCEGLDFIELSEAQGSSYYLSYALNNYCYSPYTEGPCSELEGTAIAIGASATCFGTLSGYTIDDYDRNLCVWDASDSGECYVGATCPTWCEDYLGGSTTTSTTCSEACGSKEDLCLSGSPSSHCSGSTCYYHLDEKTGEFTDCSSTESCYCADKQSCGTSQTECEDRCSSTGCSAPISPGVTYTGSGECVNYEIGDKAILKEDGTCSALDECRMDKVGTSDDDCEGATGDYNSVNKDEVVCLYSSQNSACGPLVAGDSSLGECIVIEVGKVFGGDSKLSSIEFGVFSSKNSCPNGIKVFGCDADKSCGYNTETGGFIGQDRWNNIKTVDVEGKDAKLISVEIPDSLLDREWENIALCTKWEYSLSSDVCTYKIDWVALEQPEEEPTNIGVGFECWNEIIEKDKGNCAGSGCSSDTEMELPCEDGGDYLCVEGDVNYCNHRAGLTGFGQCIRFPITKEFGSPIELEEIKIRAKGDDGGDAHVRFFGCDSGCDPYEDETCCEDISASGEKIEFIKGYYYVVRFYGPSSTYTDKYNFVGYDYIDMCVVGHTQDLYLDWVAVKPAAD